jgi:malate dehydrogenase
LSSAASAANAAIEHIRDWVLGSNGQWVSMAVPSTGSYGVDKDLVYSYPVICKDGKYEIVEGLKNSKASQARMEDTRKELIGERDAVAELLK